MSNVDQMSAETAERIEHYADAILKASGSALRYFTLPAVRRAILEACLELHDEAFLAGAAINLARQNTEPQHD